MPCKIFAVNPMQIFIVYYCFCWLVEHYKYSLVKSLTSNLLTMLLVRIYIQELVSIHQGFRGFMVGSLEILTFGRIIRM